MKQYSNGDVSDLRNIYLGDWVKAEVAEDLYEALEGILRYTPDINLHDRVKAENALINANENCP